jgi:hypothetical protein
MHKPFLSAFAFVLAASSTAVGAAPVISGLSATGGSFQDNVEVTVNGSGFGTHGLDIAWLGGADGVIESGTSGRSPANANGWIFNQGAGCNMSVSSTQARSGSNALYCNENADNAFNAAVRYSHPQAIGPGRDIYVSWWVRRVHSGRGQWKMFRINHQNDIQDDAPQIVMFNWDDSDQFFVRTSSPGTGPSSWDAPYPKSDNRWYRIDFHVRTSSLGGNDGRYTMTLFDPTSGNTPRTMTVTGNTYPGSGKQYQWFLWQNYIGNGIDSQQTWLDDLYVQVGTQARVELCDRPSWSSCTFREIQQPTSWADGRITVKLNRGGFKPGDTAYLFVVDGNGVASGGTQLTIGGTAAPAPAAPRPPGNLQVN